METIRVLINSDKDIVAARQKGRTLALSIGFSETDATLIATAISELTRNIITYAKKGEVRLRAEKDTTRRGIMVIATDKGAGISNIKLALQDGFSTSGSLGLGLPGVKRLMDEFEIQSACGLGTVVTIRKWKE